MKLLGQSLCLLLVCLLGGFSCSDSGGPECSTDQQCPAGRYCRDSTGSCEFDCTFDADCPSGYRCSERGRCETGCAKTNGGVEACDELDNDCDDLTDEDFANLGQVCNKGGCEGVWVCSNDGLTTECTARQPEPDDSTCDDRDDDCDGQTDEDASDQLCELQEGVCAGTMRTCMVGGTWSECDYGPNYLAGADSVCDQLDSDCDGLTDEDAAPILDPEIGPEASDGLDNNCNGLADESGGLMVEVVEPGSGLIDAYEVAVFDNPDCTGQQYGVSSDDYPTGFPADGTPQSLELYACSLPNVMPSGFLSYHRAKRVCEAQGKTLCPNNNWSQGCHGGNFFALPYGMTFAQGACNDGYYGSREKAATGSFPLCTVGNGTYDMTGNMSEWLDALDPETPGNAFVSTIGYLCNLCNDGIDCHVCSDLDDNDWDDYSTSDSCLPLGRREKSYPLDRTAADFGTRCCLYQ